MCEAPSLVHPISLNRVPVDVAPQLGAMAMPPRAAGSETRTSFRTLKAVRGPLALGDTDQEREKLRFLGTILSKISSGGQATAMFSTCPRIHGADRRL
jgi:hypothetical protein